MELVRRRDRPTKQAAEEDEKEAARAATAGPGARRLRLQCVLRADNPLRSRPHE